MTAAEKYARSVVSGEKVTGKWIRLACEKFLKDLKRKDIVLDVQQGQRAINFIERKLRHWEGSWRGQKLILEDWQRFIVMQVFGWQKNGKRRIRSVYIQIARKNGKALALDTPIPTADGFRNMGELRYGDTVFDENGKQCKITYISPIQHNRNCYKVSFSDGSHIIADEEHRWFTETKNSGLVKKGRPKAQWNLSYEEKIKTTKQIADTLYSGGTKGGKRENNHKIPVCLPVETKDIDLIIPPYTMGVWLGDGYSSSANFIISPKDTEILDGVRNDGFLLDEKRYQEGSYTYRIHSGEGRNKPFYRFINKIRDCNLFNNKHIPSSYLIASITQRFELLKGLMDTDGTCEKGGQGVFTTTTQQLANDFYKLVCSLGFKATIRTKQPSLKGSKYCALAYSISFFAYADTPVFKLKRKYERQKNRPENKTRSSFRKIISVEPVESVPVRCIEVDSESHLYLAGESFIPTHNTSFAAAVSLYHLFADRENTPQILVGANNEDQAKICVNSAGRMIEQSPELKELVDEDKLKLSIYGRNVIGIYHHDTDGAVKAMSKNAGALDGFNPSLGVIDEYHEAKDDSLLNVLESGQGARPEPLLFVVTTAGFDKQGPCYKKLRRSSIDMLSEKVEDDAHLAFVYEMDDGDKWDDPEIWHKSNPNLGVSVYPDYLKSRLVKAKNEGGTKEVDFKTKNLNLWVDAPIVWISDEKWMMNTHGIDPEELIGATCYGGLDLATGIDINAFSLYFPKFKEINGKWISPVLWWFWIPKTQVTTENFDYSDWVNQGLMTATEGFFENVIDHKKIVFDICELPKKYNIQAIAFDQRLAYHGVVQELGPVFGTTEDEQFIQGLYPFTQSMPNVSLPTKALEAEIVNGQLEHFSNPVARWMMGNVVLKVDPVGQIMPDKSRSQHKIDGIAALVNAKAIDIRINTFGGIETLSTAI